MTPAADNEHIASRILHHSRKHVYEAFSDPAQLTLWFGPNGFTSTFETFDFKVGGDWVFVFHGPDGTDYLNRSVFVEIIPLELITYDHVVNPHFRMTMSFEDAEGGTLLTWRMAFETAEVCQALKPVCVPANEENFNRLEAHLSNPTRT